MSTIYSLMKEGALRPVPVYLEPGDIERRSLLGTPEFIEWYKNELPRIPRDLDKQINPQQQVESLFSDYVTGVWMNYPDDFKELRPVEKGVFEFCPLDVRVFGFIPEARVFVACFGCSAKAAHDHDLHNGFRDQTVRIRDALGLEYIDGSDLDAALL